MKVVFTGTGTSQGVPVIGCKCAVCISADRRDNRLRTSVYVEVNGLHLVVDSGPDFRYQMLRHHVNKLDAILFTHSHKDHISGLDDVRAYNYFQQKAIDVYATIETQRALKREYAYIFENSSYPGIPQIKLHTINANDHFHIRDIEITPIGVRHYEMDVLGFRIQNFTYITDANYIPPSEMEKIKGTDVLVLNALRHQKHISHFTLKEAIEVALQAQAKQTYLTHISHQLGLHQEVEKSLPPGVHLAYDGLELNL